MDRATARRMRALRYTEAGPFPMTFIARLGLDKQAWYRAERLGIVPQKLGFALVSRCPGITLDWIYLGRDDALSIGRKRRLNQAIRTLQFLDKLTTEGQTTEAKVEEQ